MPLTDTRAFRAPLWMTGWSQQSLWGYDEPTATYFALLWRDGESGDGPPVQGLDGIPVPIDSRVELSLRIARALGMNPDKVIIALSSHP
jgi:hypothetical protein